MEKIVRPNRHRQENKNSSSFVQYYLLIYLAICNSISLDHIRSTVSDRRCERMRQKTTKSFAWKGDPHLFWFRIMNVSSHFQLDAQKLITFCMLFFLVLFAICQNDDYFASSKSQLVMNMLIKKKEKNKQNQRKKLWQTRISWCDASVKKSDTKFTCTFHLLYITWPQSLFLIFCDCDKQIKTSK